MLSARDAHRVAGAVISRISRASLALPLAGEPEPAFTARVLMPLIRKALDDIDIEGLTLSGDGAAPTPTIVFPSCEFRPDVALLYYRDRAVAFEVKFLRQIGRQSSLAAAIGQATIYRAHGYKSVGIILLDIAAVRGEAQLVLSMLEKLSLSSAIFVKSGLRLVSANS